MQVTFCHFLFIHWFTYPTLSMLSLKKILKMFDASNKLTDVIFSKPPVDVSFSSSLVMFRTPHHSKPHQCIAH